jgi:hypothetical protein
MKNPLDDKKSPTLKEDFIWSHRVFSTFGTSLPHNWNLFDGHSTMLKSPIKIKQQIVGNFANISSQTLHQSWESLGA